MAKPRDNKERMVIDYRRVNLQTRMDSHPVPVINDLLAKLGGSAFFTTLDLLWLLPDPSASGQQSLHCLRTSSSLWQFNFLPMGVKPAVAIFQRIIQQVCAGIPGVLPYVDDILIHSRTFDEHLRALDQVLSRLVDFNMFASAKKALVGFAKLRYLC